MAANEQGQPLGPRRRYRLPNLLFPLSDADGRGIALRSRRRPWHGGTADRRHPGRAPTGSGQTHRYVATGLGPRPDYPVRYRPHRQLRACRLEYVVGDRDVDDRRQHLLWQGAETRIFFLPNFTPWPLAPASRSLARSRSLWWRYCPLVLHLAGVQRLARNTGAQSGGRSSPGSSSSCSASSTATDRIGQRRNGSGSAGGRLRRQRYGSLVRLPSPPTSRSSESDHKTYGLRVRHHLAALVLSDRLCHPRGRGIERGDRASSPRRLSGPNRAILGWRRGEQSFGPRHRRHRLPSVLPAIKSRIDRWTRRHNVGGTALPRTGISDANGEMRSSNRGSSEIAHNENNDDHYANYSEDIHFALLPLIDWWRGALGHFIYPTLLFSSSTDRLDPVLNKYK